MIREIENENLKKVCLFSLGGVRGSWDKEGSLENIAFEMGLGGSVEEGERKSLLFSSLQLEIDLQGHRRAV